MTIYIPRDSDINISSPFDAGVACSREVKKEIARKLYALYESGKVANMARTFALCPVCGEVSTFHASDGNVVPLSRCIIVKECQDGNVITQVQWIHILQEHDTEVDPKLIEYFYES